MMEGVVGHTRIDGRLPVRGARRVFIDRPLSSYEISKRYAIHWRCDICNKDPAPDSHPEV